MGGKGAESVGGAKWRVARLTEGVSEPRFRRDGAAGLCQVDGALDGLAG